MKANPLKEMEIEIGVLLRVGVGVSAAIVALAGIAYLMRHGGDPTNYRVFRSEPRELRSLSGIWATSLRGSPPSIIQAGLVVLIAIPVVRVAFSSGSFAKQRDWMYVTFTVIVLLLLGYGLFG